MIHKWKLESIRGSKYYRCDSANNSYKPLENLICLGGVDTIGPGEYLQRYRCNRCDFDTYIPCTLRYAYTPI